MTDAEGGTIYIGYDAAGNAVRYEDQMGGVSTAEYDVLGRLVRRVAPDGGEYRYEYDALGRIVGEQDPLGLVTGCAYDAAGRLTSVTLPNGGVLSYAYGAGGAPESETDALGNVTRYETDPRGLVTARTTAAGARYEYSYDTLGRITEILGPEGERAAYAYGGFGGVVSETDALGRVTRYAYDSARRLVSITDPSGGETKIGYDLSDNITSVTTPSGLTESYAYDAAGRLTQKTDPSGAATSYAYDRLGRLVETRSAGGGSESYSYDPCGRLTRYTDPTGAEYSYGYDAAGRLTTLTDPSGGVTSLGYDLSGRLTSLTDAAGGVTVYGYDELGNVTGAYDAAGRGVGFVYDLMGRLTETRDGAGTTAYAYDADGNMTSRTDALGNVTEYGYDLSGRQTSVVDCAGRVESYSYDAAGNLLSYTSRTGRTVSYCYNELDAVVKREAEGEASAEYSYDPDGRLSAMTDGSGTSSFTYDAGGRLCRYTNGAGETVEYGYDADGNISRIVYPDGNSVGYTRDGAGRILSVEGRDGETTDYTYDERGNAVRVERSDGTATSARYDELGRITELYNLGKDGAVLTAYRYEYDEGGLMTRAEETAADGSLTVHEYEYNARGELVRSRENGAETTYSYDAWGNRTRMTTPEGTTTYRYDESGLLCEVRSPEGTASYLRDADGNVVGVVSPDGSETEYGYTADGRLTTVHVDGELVLSTLYDGLGEQVFSLRYTEVEASGTVVTRRPQSADGNEAESGSPSPTYGDIGSAEAPESASNAAGEADPFLYVFGVCFLSLSGGVNRASSVFHARQFGEWWLETFWDKGDASHAVEYGAELESALEDAGFSGRDVSNMQGAGVSEKDALAVAATRTTEATAEDGTVPEIDAVYRVNDLLSEYTEVLMTASEVYGESYYTYGEGRLYSDDGKGEKQTYLYDGRGSVTAVVSRIEVVCSLSYTDYGAAVGEPPHELQSFFGYNGEEHDPLTGLQYLRARYYDPAVGSFTTRDPFEGTAETPLSQNGFTYAHNNPVNLTDPSGMFVKPFKVMNDGGSSSRRPKVGAAAAVAATMAKKGVEGFKAKAANRNALNTPRPQSTVPRPGRHFLPEELERLKAQSLVYLRKSCNPNAKRARSQAVAEIRLENSFQTAMRDAYGFDTEISGIMLDVMDAIDAAYPYESQAKRDWRYARLLGGFSYNTDTPIGTLFKVTSGVAVGYDDMEEQEYFTEVLGMSESDYQKLRYAVQLQHDISYKSRGSYTDDDLSNYNEAMGTSYSYDEFKPIWEKMYDRYHGEENIRGDFAHEIITQSTFLYSGQRHNNFSDPVNRMAKLFGLAEPIIIETVNIVSENITGWAGDVVLGDHTMEAPDVLSDLDSVNISNLMRDNGTDYFTATAQYYEGIRTGVIDRDKMFLSDINFGIIRLACVYVAGGLLTHMTDEELEQKLQAEYKDIYAFYMRMKEAYEQ